MDVNINLPTNDMHLNVPHHSHSAERCVRMTVTDYKKVEQQLNSLNSRLKSYANLQNQLQQRDQELACYKKLAKEYQSKYDQLRHQTQLRTHNDTCYPPKQESYNQIDRGQPSQSNPSQQINSQPLAQLYGENKHDQHRPQILMQPSTQAQPVINGATAGVQQVRNVDQQLILNQRPLFQQSNEHDPIEMSGASLSLDFSLNSNGGTYSGMEDLLETLQQQNQLPKQQETHVAVPQNPVSQWTYRYDSIAVDGDGEMSLENLKKNNIESSKGSTFPAGSERKVSKTTTVPKHIFRELLQNNVRMQRSLTDLLSTRDTRLSQLEYEAVISQLGSRVTEAEGKYRRLKSTIKDCDEDTQKFGRKIADYETQIAELRNVLTLKQSLLKFYTNEDVEFKLQQTKENKNYEKPDSVDAEAQTALDIDGLALTLSNTCLGEEISYKNTQIARLKDAIESDQLELKELESKKAQLEKDVSDKEAALSSIKSCMEAQARKLKDTVEEVSQQEHRNQQLQDTYKDYETKLANIRKEMESKSSTLENEEMKSLFLTQMQQYEEDFRKMATEKDKHVKKLEAQNQRFAEENEKLRLMLKQKEHGREAQRPTRRPMDMMSDRSPRCKDYDAPWTNQQHYRQHLVQDGPPSTLSLDSLRQSPSQSRTSPAGTPEHRSGSPQAWRFHDSAGFANSYHEGSPKNHGLTTIKDNRRECRRCFRQFNDMDDFNSHVKKCTD